MSYLGRIISKGRIPQHEPLDSRQVKNDAGGYTYQLDKWAALRRFLVIGTEGNTMYVGERNRTQRSLEAVKSCLDENGTKTVDEIVAISDAGRASKNDQAVLALAMASIHEDAQVRRYAFDALPNVCRIGTHLFQFVDFRKELGAGWGRLMRESIAAWFNEKEADSIAFQVAKYKQREGWSMRDLLRLSHAKPRTRNHNALFHWVVSGGEVKGYLPKFLKAVNKANEAEYVEDIVKLIEEFNLPREVLPTEVLNEPEIWEAMLPKMPIGALVRNLGKMTSIGVVSQGSDAARMIAKKLSNQEAIRNSRIHPVQVLVAMMTYQSGGGVRGKLSWKPVQSVVDVLDNAFYMSFGNVEPTGKRTMLAVDVSGSMYWNPLMGVPGFYPGIAAAALSMVTLRTENPGDALITAFSHKFAEVKIGQRNSLDEVVAKFRNIDMGATDCALPMLYAAHHRLKVDAFVIYTDSQTWFGRVHPMEALRQYRKSSGIPAQLIVVGMESNGFTIGDPLDAGCLDVVGFDVATPRILSEFIAGNV